MIPVIGRGKTKTVYALCSEAVLKIGPSDRITKQARRLRRLDRAGVPVACVLLAGDGWLIQERCELIDVPDGVVDKLYNFAISRGFAIHDLHHKNIGWLRDQWVILDCGALGKKRRSPVEVLAEAKDFTLRSTWTEFTAYSPDSDSDFNLLQPYYTVVESSSATAARRLHKALLADPEALELVTWHGLRAWLKARGIGHKTRFSQWTW